jgi:hypothetical protein
MCMCVWCCSLLVASGRVGGGEGVAQRAVQRLTRMQLRQRQGSLPSVARVFSLFFSFVLVSFFNILDAFAEDSAEL